MWFVKASFIEVTIMIDILALYCQSMLLTLCQGLFKANLHGNEFYCNDDWKRSGGGRVIIPYRKPYPSPPYYLRSPPPFLQSLLSPSLLLSLSLLLPGIIFLGF